MILSMRFCRNQQTEQRQKEEPFAHEMPPSGNVVQA
jgi:hypothetical protein